MKTFNSLTRVFKVYLDKKWLVILNKNDFDLFENSSKKLNAEEESRLWLNKRYVEFKESLVEVLSQTNAETKRQKHSHVIKVIWETSMLC